MGDVLTAHYSYFKFQEVRNPRQLKFRTQVYLRLLVVIA